MRRFAVGHNWAAVSRLHAGGRFLAISIPWKALLSRAPCFFAHSAISWMPSRSEVSGMAPNTCFTRSWLQKTNFTSLRPSRWTTFLSQPMASATTSVSSFIVQGVSPPMLNTRLIAAGIFGAAAITGIMSST